MLLLLLVVATVKLVDRHDVAIGQVKSTHDNQRQITVTDDDYTVFEQK